MFKKTKMILYEPYWFGKTELNGLYTTPPKTYYYKDVVMEFKEKTKKGSTYVMKPVVKTYHLVSFQEVGSTIVAIYGRDTKEVEQELKKKGVIYAN